jgi:phosphoglycerol transferase MdoB-like AlkP superfamily enzyme
VAAFWVVVFVVVAFLALVVAALTFGVVVIPAVLTASFVAEAAGLAIGWAITFVSAGVGFVVQYHVPSGKRPSLAIES